jgi:membrane-bound lytic murein transglycosylase D
MKSLFLLCVLLIYLLPAQAATVPVQISPTARGLPSMLSEFKIPKEMTLKWLKFYTGRGKAALMADLARGERYKKVVHNVMDIFNLPRELYYMGVIESGFKFKALSSAKARGPWQFMEATAKTYGLRVDDHLDERLNLVKSTIAAATYLRDLYNFFQSWPLAVAAYNSGEYGIIRAIRKAQGREWAKMAEKKVLPDETINYLAKIWVVANIDANRKLFGFENTPKADGIMELPRFVKVDQRLSIDSIIREFKINKATFQFFNPDILSEVIPGTSGNPVEVYLPGYRL